MADHIAPARPSRSGGSCSRRLPLHVCVALSARVTKAKKRGSSKSTNAIKNPAEFARFRSEDANNAAARCEGGVEAADRVDGAMGQPPSPRCSRAQQTCGPAWALPRSPPGSAWHRAPGRGSRRGAARLPAHAWALWPCDFRRVPPGLCPRVRQLPLGPSRHGAHSHPARLARRSVRWCWQPRRPFRGSHPGLSGGPAGANRHRVCVPESTIVPQFFA